MKAPENLYLVVCDEWMGSRYARSNVGIYSDHDTASMAAQSMQDNYKTSDIEYWVDEVEFCEIWKQAI